MTEQDFLSCTDLASLVNYLVGKVGERKLRLWACAVARLKWGEMTDPRSRVAVETSERYADGEATREELEGARREALDVWQNRGSFSEPGPIRAYQSCDLDPWFHVVNLWSYTTPGERIALLREIVGNPFSQVFYTREPIDLLRPPVGRSWTDIPIDMDPWLPPPTLHMARTIYRERDFSALPLLADLLEDSGEYSLSLEENGCQEELLLHHLRGENKHTRGCWALDLLTGRK